MRLECDHWSKIKVIEQPTEDELDEFLQKLIGPVNLEADLSSPPAKNSSPDLPQNQGLKDS